MVGRRPFQVTIALVLALDPAVQAAASAGEGGHTALLCSARHVTPQLSLGSRHAHRHHWRRRGGSADGTGARQGKQVAHGRTGLVSPSDTPGQMTVSPSGPAA